MHRKPVRVTARAVALGGTLVLGLGSAQAAMAGSPNTVDVPCYAGALASAISGATSGETIVLAPGCVYHLYAALPTVAVDMKIIGYDTELLGLGDRADSGFPLLSVGDEVDLTIVNVDFKDGGGSDVDGGAIYIPDDSNVTVDGGIFTDNYYAAYYGGAIYNYGITTINGSTFEKNVSPDEDGGAIYNEGVMQINASTLTGNSSYYGAIYNEPDLTGSLTLNRDDFTG